MPKTNKKSIGFDYDEVASLGVFEDGSVIITGRPSSDNEEILETLSPKVPSKIYNYPHDDLDEDNRNIKIGMWKAQLIRQLGIQKFFEDTPEQILLIKEINPKIEVVKVSDGIPNEPMNFIIFTYDMTILPVAEKLIKEGNTVKVGVIQDKRNILLPEEKYKPENPEKKAQRLSIYDGMIEKHSAEKLIKEMKSIKNKDEWIILTDSNSNYKFTEMALEMGFTKGIFPLQKDREMEVDRMKAKEFVKEHYPDIEVAEVKSFKTIEEGIAFLNESEEVWVLKSQGDAGDTICPESDDIEMAKEQLIAAMEEMQSEYEQNGYILEMKIQEVTELTPEIMFWDGVPVFTSLDIENKGIAAGNTGTQTGCMQNLIVRTEMEDRINKIAFPEIVHEMAKERKGLFVWDLSILIDKKGRMFFGEYCSQRFGWDSFPTELGMAGDEDGTQIATPFFAKLIRRKNPLRVKFGAGVRILNIGSGGKMIDEGTVKVKDEALPDVYLYEVKMKKDEMVSTTSGYDFALVTGVHDELYEAVEHCYKYADMVMFEGKYIRPEFDFNSYSYHSSIMNRYQYAVSNGLISDNREDDEDSEPHGLSSINQPSNY